VTSAAPPGKRIADALVTMHPFRTRPDTIDSVVCGRCGHPVWDHCISDTCTQCDNGEPDGACGFFKLFGFTEVTATPLDDLARSYSNSSL
jgi:hypothetical protein